MTRRKERTTQVYSEYPVIISVKEAAEISGYSENFIRKHIRIGTLRRAGLPGSVRLVTEEFLAAICRKGGKVFR